MRSTIYKIKDIVSCFNNISDGKSPEKARKFKLEGIQKAAKSGKAASKIAHHQGIFKLDGNDNYIITGSRKSLPSYFYCIKGGQGTQAIGGKDYFETHKEFTHPGGIQVAEQILVVGHEKYNNLKLFTRKDCSRIRFYDISNPNNIKELRHLRIKDRNSHGEIASAIGLTKLNDQWIMAVRALKTIDFYILDGDINAVNNRFKAISRLDIAGFSFEEFQGLNLFVDEHDDLFSFGMPKKSKKQDKCWMHQIQLIKSRGKIVDVRGADLIAVKHFKRNGNGPRFKYASCINFIPYDHTIIAGEAVQGYFEVISASAHVDTQCIRCNEWKGIQPSISQPDRPSDPLTHP